MLDPLRIYTKENIIFYCGYIIIISLYSSIGQITVDVFNSLNAWNHVSFSSCNRLRGTTYKILMNLNVNQHRHFSVHQIGGPTKKGSHVYFLLQVFWVILLFDINVILMLPWWPDVTIVQSDVTIVVPWQLSTGSKHDYLFCYCPLVGILFEVLRIIATYVDLSRETTCLIWAEYHTKLGCNSTISLYEWPLFLYECQH